ncbi:MAG: polysaccharide deacetylase family protein, partial [Fusobacteriaceae bacterium]
MFKKNFFKIFLFLIVFNMNVFSKETPYDIGFWDENPKMAKVIRGGSSEKKLLALTFDDGPNDTSLLKILELLKEHDIKASFFFIGSYIKNYPEETIKTFDEGHLVLNHTYAHPNLKNYSENEIFLEVSKGNQIIRDVLKKNPKMYRPPYGVVTKSKLQALGRLNMVLIGWNVDSRDWSNHETLNSVIQITKGQIKSGSIILMHTQPGKMRTYEALKILIPYLQGEGYTFVKL